MTFSTINDFYVSEIELEHSPSTKQGVSQSDEVRLRRYGASLIWDACHRLELPMSVYSTASVLLHRFYCKESLTTHDVRVASCAVFWMACKLEEVIDCDDPSTLRLRDVLVMFYDCICRRQENESEKNDIDIALRLLNVYSTFYARFKDAVIRAERDMLRCFGFVMHVEHAVPFVLTLGAQLGMASRKEILQMACDLASDSLRTTLCVRVKAECVACAALFLAAKKHGYGLPDDWWEGCGVDWSSMEMGCREMIQLYDPDRRGDYVCLSSDFLTFDSSNGSDAVSVACEGRLE